MQLRLAQQVGLRIPESLITTSPTAARSFLEHHHGRVIYKRLSPDTLYDEHGRATPNYTTAVSDELAARLDQVTVTPCLFQENIQKAYELRVTVVDAFVIAARVDSQDNPSSRTDWRYDLAARWSPHALDGNIRMQLHKLMKLLDLRFGAFDLIVTPTGDHVFLEVNPAGQWAWFDDEITHPIRDAIANLLATGSAVTPSRQLH